MTIVNTTGAPGASDNRSPQLPMELPSGKVHVYFINPSIQTKSKDGTQVERSVVYFTLPSGEKRKWMTKQVGIRTDLKSLHALGDKLATVDEEFSWAKGGALTIKVVPRA